MRLSLAQFRRSPSASTDWLVRAVLVATSLFFATFFLWPVAQILRGGFIDANGRLTARYLVALLRDPIYLAGLGNAVAIAAATTVLAALFAVPLAWLADRFEFPGKRLATSLVLVPMILPPFVGAIGLRQLFGQAGAANAVLHAVGWLAPGDSVDWFAAHRFWGVVLVEALSLYPILYLNTVAALAKVDPAMEEAAQNLGSTGWRRFRRITLPLIRPGLFAGGTIVFIWAFTELGTPLIFDYDRVTAVQVYEGLKDIGANPLPFTLVSVMLAASVALYALGKGVFGRAPAATEVRAAHPTARRRSGTGARWAVTGAFAAMIAIAVLPHVAVVLLAFAQDWYGTILPSPWTLGNLRLALGHDLTVPAIGNSVRYAAAATVIDVVLGTAIAYVVVRSRSRWRHVLDAVAMLPLAVPGLVLAFGYLAMAREGAVLGFLNPTRNPTVLLIIAYAVRRLPYVVRSAAAGLEQTSATLEEAARSLGSGPWRALRRITLPLITANLLAGGLLAFAFAMLEVSDSLILAQKQQYYPITKAILQLVELLGDGRFIACALGVWAMLFLGLVVTGLGVLLGRRVGALFRV